LHRHAATRTRIALTRNDPDEITLSLFFYSTRRAVPIHSPQVSHYTRTALAADVDTAAGAPELLGKDEIGVPDFKQQQKHDEADDKSD
jgi:hypothetical protein